jgi:hypothetical protein
MTGALVALSIDATPSYALLARRCLESIRAAGTRLPIVVFASAGARLDVTGLGGVEVVTTGPPWHRSVHIDTWHRLSQLGADRVLSLDADTICSQPLEQLFDRYRDHSVYAREELGTQRDGQAHLVGSMTVVPQVDWPAFLAQKESLGVADVRIINTGVMLFNNGSCRLIASHLGLLQQVRDDWVSGRRPYPCTNRHIVEELAVSVMLGCEPRFDLALLRRDDAPFYCEARAGLSGPGVITHIWTGLYRSYLRERVSDAALKEYDVLHRRDLLSQARRAKHGILRERWTTDE